MKTLKKIVTMRKRLSTYSLCLTTLIISCSSTKTQVPQWSHQAVTQNGDEQLIERQKKWEQFELGNGIPNAPYYFVSAEALKNIRRGRMPSAMTNKKRSLQSISDRSLYFLSLYEQFGMYRQFLPLSEKISKVETCPAFHSAMLEYFPHSGAQEKVGLLTKELNLPWDKIKNGPSSTWALFPELSLPLQTESPFPAALEYLKNQSDLNANEVVMNALNLQGEKMREELKKLCEDGQTDNSYVFENTITYLKEHSTQLSQEESLKILNRLPMFSNLTLLNVLLSQSSERSPASVTSMGATIEDELLERLKGTWAKDYWANLIKLRRDHY